MIRFAICHHPHASMLPNTQSTYIIIIYCYRSKLCISNIIFWTNLKESLHPCTLYGQRCSSLWWEMKVNATDKLAACVEITYYTCITPRQTKIVTCATTTDYYCYSYYEQVVKIHLALHYWGFPCYYRFF